MRKIFLYLFIVSFTKTIAQKFIEPSDMKRFNIVVNNEDCTIKTQMLSVNKKITPNNGRIYLWYSTHKIMETKGGFDGKLLHGTYRSFYLNDQLKEQGLVCYGLKDKQWKYWYPDGNLKETITWKHGMKTGKYHIYNNDGQLMAVGHFKRDKLHGKFSTYEPNGTLIETKKYWKGFLIMPKVKKQKAEKQSVEKKPKKEKKSKKKTKETKPDAKVVQA